ncbi:Rv3235 family protein [Spirillospora sp. NPDC127200]
MPSSRNRPPVRVVPYTPYSGVQSPAGTARAHLRPVRGTPPSGPPDAPPRTPPALRLVRPPETGVRDVAELTARLVIEVLAGIRVPRHLDARALPQVRAGVAAHQIPVAAGARVAPPRVLSVRAQEPAPGVVEASAVVLLAGHVQALAFRLERHRGRWRCTAVETTTPVRSRPAARRAG